MKRIRLSQNKIAKIDDADFSLISVHNWHAVEDHGNFYAYTNVKIDGKRTIRQMHRLIMAAPKGIQVDHINGDGLDNRRSNLRLCTQTQNARNCRVRAVSKSKFKGILWVTKRGKWRARISAANKRLYSGYFDTEIAAAKRYDEMARKHHGDFARTNF